MASKPTFRKKSSNDLSDGEKTLLLLSGPIGWIIAGLMMSSKDEKREAEVDAAVEQKATDAMEVWRRNRKSQETEFRWSTKVTGGGPSFTRTYAWTVPEDDSPADPAPEFTFDWKKYLKPRTSFLPESPLFTPQCHCSWCSREPLPGCQSWEKYLAKGIHP